MGDGVSPHSPPCLLLMSPPSFMIATLTVAGLALGLAWVQHRIIDHLDAAELAHFRRRSPAHSPSQPPTPN